MDKHYLKEITTRLEAKIDPMLERVGEGWPHLAEEDGRESHASGYDLKHDSNSA